MTRQAEQTVPCQRTSLLIEGQVQLRLCLELERNIRTSLPTLPDTPDGEDTHILVEN